MTQRTSSAKKVPTSLKVEIYFLTRDYRVLLGLVTVILLVGVLLAMRKSGQSMTLERTLWSEVEPGRIADPLGLLERALKTEEQSGKAEKVEEVARANEIAILLYAVDLGGAKEGREEQWGRAMHLIETSSFSAARKQLYLEFGKSLVSLSRQPNATLTTLAYRQQLPAANYLTALLYLRLEEMDRVQHFLVREGEFAESVLARKMAVMLAMEQRDVALMEKMSADPAYRGEWTPVAAMYLAVEKQDWWTAVHQTLRYQWQLINPDILLLALVSGGIWVVIWLQAIQIWEAPMGRFFLCIAALLLGALSTTPTLLMVMGMERYLGLVEGKGLWQDVAYYMLGVGPREEFCKWLAVLPLVPTLLRRGSRLEMLMVSGFVGLGFAFEENFTYFSQHVMAPYTRFLTANFLHVAATALVGWSFMETWMNPRKLWWLFPLCFLEVSALHGAYDVFIAVSQLEALQVLSSVLFVILAMRFFRKLRQFRSLETNYFWMPAGIVLGLTVVMAMTLVDASARTGFGPALVVLGYHAITFCMLIYLFVWQTWNLRYDADL